MLFTILILISAFAVIAVLREILQSRRCPSEYTLKSVVLGRYKGREEVIRNVQRHLGVCSKCRAKVDGLMNDDTPPYKHEDILISDE